MDPPNIRVLRRPSQKTNTSNRKNAKSSVPSKTLEQREADYAAARRRIMGSESEDTAGILDEDSAASASATTALKFGNTATKSTEADQPEEHHFHNLKIPSSSPQLPTVVKSSQATVTQQLPVAIPLMSIPTAALPIPSSLDGNPRTFYQQQGLPSALAAQQQCQGSTAVLPQHYTHRPTHVPFMFGAPAPFAHQPSQQQPTMQPHHSDALANGYSSAPQLLGYCPPQPHMDVLHQQSVASMQMPSTQEQLFRQQYQTFAAANIASSGSTSQAPQKPNTSPQSGVYPNGNCHQIPGLQFYPATTR